ncbi:hypothetical protein [uncultured Leptotrichia sp.]|uniref:hypothetical protein n=1 Tax=uncultured Leptotrichia sp. TaxID=159271 RepID=UPI0025EDF9B7|nr:hypothetical protein [uncultured Leptotrichia sp.]
MVYEDGTISATKGTIGGYELKDGSIVNKDNKVNIQFNYKYSDNKSNLVIGNISKYNNNNDIYSIYSEGYGESNSLIYLKPQNKCIGLEIDSTYYNLTHNSESNIVEKYGTSLLSKGGAALLGGKSNTVFIDNLALSTYYLDSSTFSLGTDTYSEYIKRPVNNFFTPYVDVNPYRILALTSDE